ncbi:MAG: rhodanese-like domain-containing protein [Aliarcobacter sp.]|nr:rhodanese-like domain-containing protein [Aliarcobacter sp.]
MVTSKVDADGFIELFNKGEAILLDVRYPFERTVWTLPFSVNIPLNELPDRLEELPKDKIIVCACPESCRSNIAKQYLAHKKSLILKFLTMRTYQTNGATQRWES